MWARSRWTRLEPTFFVLCPPPSRRTNRRGAVSWSLQTGPFAYLRKWCTAYSSILASLTLCALRKCLADGALLPCSSRPTTVLRVFLEHTQHRGHCPGITTCRNYAARCVPADAATPKFSQFFIISISLATNF